VSVVGGLLVGEALDLAYTPADLNPRRDEAGSGPDDDDAEKPLRLDVQGVWVEYLEGYQKLNSKK